MAGETCGHVLNLELRRAGKVSQVDMCREEAWALLGRAIRDLNNFLKAGDLSPSSCRWIGIVFVGQC